MTELALTRNDFWRKGLDGLASVWGLILLIPIVVLALDAARTDTILSLAAQALLGTLPYIALAVLLIALLKASGAEALVARAFEGRESRMIVLAALIGGLAPFCSCEVIPFIAGLLAVGAPLSAVMAFWLSSPLMDPPTLLITAGALGWEFAIGKAVAAVALGLFGGFAISACLRLGVFADPLRPTTAGGCGSCAAPGRDGPPVWQVWRHTDRRRVFKDQALTNGLFLLKWLTFAYLLEALLIVYVPADAIATVVGGEGFLPIVIGALVGAPAYLNGYAAPPLIAGLMEQGMSAGAAMAFMVAGGVSSIPAMAAVWSLVRRSVFAAYCALGIAGAVIIGSLFAAVV